MIDYELIDHTADIGVKAYGKTLDEAFENAAKAMFDIITDKSEIESIGQFDISLEAPNLEQVGLAERASHKPTCSRILIALSRSAFLMPSGIKGSRTFSRADKVGISKKS